MLTKIQRLSIVRTATSSSSQNALGKCSTYKQRYKQVTLSLKNIRYKDIIGKIHWIDISACGVGSSWEWETENLGKMSEWCLI